MEKLPRPNFRRNFVVNLLDGGFFGFGIGFSSFTAILPLFVSTMTDSAILIGLIPAIHNVGWQAPQLFYAHRISRMSRFKPYVMIMTTQERIPFLGFALIAFLYPYLKPEASLMAFFFLLVWHGLGAGFTANTWQNMIGKVIPADYLATFFGLQAAAANLFASFGAVIAGYLLDNLPSPQSFGYCFLITFGFLGLSWLSLNLTVENEKAVEPAEANPPNLWNMVKKALGCNPGFRWFLFSRIVWQFGLMAFGFYIIYAVNFFQMSNMVAGVVTGALMLSQVAANPILGWLADRWNRKIILEIGALSTCLSALLALLAPEISWFYPVMVFAGIANAAFWTIGMAFSMDFGKEEERPTFVGLSNTLPSPATIIAPLIGGLMADTIGYSATFIAAAIAGLITYFILHYLVPQPGVPLQNN